MLRHLRLACAALLFAAPAIAQTPAPRTPAPAPSAAPAPAPTPTAAAPTPAAAPAPATATPFTGKKLDINSATLAQLDALPGVGAARAKSIVAARPITDLDDLVTKKAIPQSVLDQDRDRMALADINKTSARDMARILPGIGDVRAAAIVKGRPYATPQDLVTKNVLGAPLVKEIEPLVTY